jgi:hypothetical protein
MALFTAQIKSVDMVGTEQGSHVVSVTECEYCRVMICNRRLLKLVRFRGRLYGCSD